MSGFSGGGGGISLSVANTWTATQIHAHLTVEGVTSTGATGTGKFVFDGSPTLVTPTIGVATATSVTASGLLQAGSTLGISTDVLLNRDAANTFAQRNGTNAQRGKFFNTWTDSSNGEWFDIDWITNANVATIGTNNNGTGVARNLRINIGGTIKADYGITNGGQWTFVNNVITIAAFKGGVGANGGLYMGSDVNITSVSSGVCTIWNNGQTDFGRIQFGGITSSFPALKRSSTILQARLADDSGDAFMQGKLRTVANAVAETITPDHTLVLYDAAGTAYRVPCQV